MTELTFHKSAAGFMLEAFGYTLVDGTVQDSAGVTAHCHFCHHDMTDDNLAGFVRGDGDEPVLLCNNICCMMEHIDACAIK